MNWNILSIRERKDDQGAYKKTTSRPVWSLLFNFMAEIFGFWLI